MADQLGIYAERPTSKKVVGCLKAALRKIVDLIKQLIRIFNPNGTNISNLSLLPYLIVFLYPSKLIKVALPFFKSFLVFFPGFFVLPL